MPDYEDLKFELSNGVATLTLNRPEQMNAFSGPMGESLGRAFVECDKNDDVRAVVLTGAGSAFCVGADMAAGAETFGKQDHADFSAAAVDPPAFAIRKPVIAAVNGHAVGLGLTLALQADMRIVAREGKYGVLQVRRGVMPDAYSHWTLPRLVGMARAAEILLTGRKFTGKQAVELGIANQCVDAKDVLAAANDLANDIAVNVAPLSAAVTKRLLWQSSELSAAEVERFETELHHHLMGKPDAIEGAVAYIERRAPKWSLSATEDFPKWPGAKSRGPECIVRDRKIDTQ